jgi:hypothetical protein
MEATLTTQALRTKRLALAAQAGRRSPLARQEARLAALTAQTAQTNRR